MESLALVVEDDPGERGVLTLLLESAGWLVVGADDGRSGLQLARRINPDVVVTDLRMPRMTGMELAEALATSPGLRGVPRVAITANGSRLRAAAERSGLFVTVLTKPVVPASLLEVLERATGNGSAG